MKVFVLLAVLVACYAQPPPPPCKGTEPPKIAETFESTTMVHRREHDEPEFQGEGMWDRNYETGEAVEEAKFTYRGHPVQEERLWLFDKHMEYFIITNSSGSTCRHREINSEEKIPEIWGWLKEAHCMKRQDPRANKTFDAWESHIQDMSITLYIDEANPDVPVGLVTRDRRGEEDVRFTKFMATTPPSTVFQVPASCNSRRH